jgi:hypothetical protein
MERIALECFVGNTINAYLVAFGLILFLFNLILILHVILVGTNRYQYYIRKVGMSQRLNFDR